MPKRVTRRVYDVNKKKSDGPHARWSEKQRYDAVALYRIVGSLRAVSGALGIPEDTMRRWHIAPWWKEYEEEIRLASQSQLQGKMEKIADRAIKVVEDRLENGDWLYDNKTGQFKRKPVGAHVANKIMNDAVDRQLMIEKLKAEDKKEATKEQITNRLLKLQEEFIRFSKAKEIIPNEKGGDPVDSILTLPEEKHALHA